MDVDIGSIDSCSMDITLPVSNLTGGQSQLNWDTVSRFVNITSPDHYLESGLPLDVFTFLPWEVQPDFSLKAVSQDCGLDICVQTTRLTMTNGNPTTDMLKQSLANMSFQVVGNAETSEIYVCYSSSTKFDFDPVGLQPFGKRSF